MRTPEFAPPEDHSLVFLRGGSVHPARRLCRGGAVTKVGIDATRPLKGRFPQINFSEGLGGIDLSKIFQES